MNNFERIALNSWKLFSEEWNVKSMTKEHKFEIATILKSMEV